MGRWLLILAVAVSAFAANVKLYLKDGDHHLVREYQVQADRVRYYSVERGDWEEIPLDLVDLKRTEAEIKKRQETIAEESRLVAAEDKAEREREREVSKVPQGLGVHLVAGKELRPLKAAESKVHNNKRRSVLKVLAPIPIVSGKATLELDGDTSPFKVAGVRPEFYIRLSAEQRFGIIKLTPQKGVRIVEKITIVPVTKEMVEEPIEVEIFRQQVEEGLYKIWPVKPLEPGEYAVVEYTEGKMNMQVWDFSYPGSSPAN
ncbi:MAG: hypothetical protein HY013_16855 [Candidatus Solibacter usitatus]|nr:hypothetical protein [Candidatus Solibacter usitatus]